jgi:hypothetical protein
MAVSVAGVLRAINNLSGPLKEKALKKFGLSMQGKPGRTSKKDGINVGKDRVKIKEKIDKNIGRFQAVGAGAAAYAAYSAGDFINDLLGIKKLGRGTLNADGAGGEYRKLSAKEAAKLKTKKPTPKKKAVKKTPPKAPPPKPDSVKKKKNGVTYSYEVIPKGKYNKGKK